MVTIIVKEAKVVVTTGVVIAKLAVGETTLLRSVVVNTISVLSVKDLVPKILVVKEVVGITGVTLAWSVTTELTDSNVVISALVKPEVGMLSPSVLVKSNVEGITSLVEITGIVMIEDKVVVIGTELVFTVPPSVVNNTDPVTMSVGNITISVDSINDGGTGNVVEGVTMEVEIIIDVIGIKLTSSVLNNIRILVSVLCTVDSKENSKVAVNTSDTT